MHSQVTMDYFLLSNCSISTTTSPQPSPHSLPNSGQNREKGKRERKKKGKEKEKRKGKRNQTFGQQSCKAHGVRLHLGHEEIAPKATRGAGSIGNCTIWENVSKTEPQKGTRHSSVFNLSCLFSLIAFCSTWTSNGSIGIMFKYTAIRLSFYLWFLVNILI